MSFISYLVNGISLGSIYALIALGYTMVYGIAKMLNFAHGDVIMIGGFMVYTVVSTWGMNPWLGIAAAIVVCTLLGILIERVAYKPLRQATSLAGLITAIGVSYFLQNIALLIFGANPKSFTSVVTIPDWQLAGGQLTISGETIVTISLSLVIMIALMLFINKTKPGSSCVSSCFILVRPSATGDNEVLAMGDCAINLKPTEDQLAEIAWEVAECGKHFGIDPKVAFLSYSTLGSGKGVVSQ